MGKNRDQLFEAFYKELENQYLFLRDGGTSYRRETSRLSLEVANQIKNIKPFLKMDQTKEIVSSCFSDLNEERLLDVSKMLCINANVVKRRMTMSAEVKKAIEDRRRNRKMLRLIKVKKDELDKNEQ